MRMGMKHIVIAVLAIVAVTGCSVAAGSGSGSSGGTRPAAKPGSSVSTAAKIGQPLTLTDSNGASVQATVVSVVDKTAGANDVAQAPANGQYAVITIQVKGIKGSFDVNPLNVQYQTANGNTYDETAGNAITSGFDPQLPSGSVAAGATSGGVLVIDTPAGAPKEIKMTDALGDVLGTWTP